MQVFELKKKRRFIFMIAHIKPQNQALESPYKLYVIIAGMETNAEFNIVCLWFNLMLQISTFTSDELIC